MEGHENRVVGPLQVFPRIEKTTFVRGKVDRSFTLDELEKAFPKVGVLVLNLVLTTNI